jgi:hypothetical protein
VKLHKEVLEMFGKRVMIPLTIVFLLLIMSSAYAAQYDISKNMSLKLGAFMPTDSDVKDVLGDTWFDARLGYFVKNTPKCAELVELGWIGKDKSFDYANAFDQGTEHFKAHMIPLTYTYEMKAPSHFYYGGGAGVYFTKLSFRNTGFDFVNNVPYSFSESRSSTKLGFHALAGYDFTKSLGAEFRYTFITSKIEGERLDGWTISLTGKF